MSSHTTDEDFISEAFERYGYKGRKQAKKIVQSFHLPSSETKSLSAGDLEFIRDAMIDTFWNAKEYNQRFVNKRYRKQEVPQ